MESNEVPRSQILEPGVGNMVEPTAPHLTTATLNKLAVPELGEKVIPFRFWKPKMLNQLPVCDPVAAFKISERHQHLVVNIVQFISLWARILKLASKLFVLQFKVTVLAQQRRIFLLQRRYLLREQNRLLFKQVNHVLGQPSGLGDADKIFNSVGSTHK